MQVSTTDLEGGEIRLTIAADPLKMPALADLHAKGQAGFDHPLDIDLSLFRSGDLILARGRLVTRVALACARCLVRHVQALDLEIDLSYLHGPGGGDPPDSAADGEAGSEREIDAREAGLTYFQGEQIDLSEGVAEQVLMGLPFKPLCHPDCRGLCSQCGVNRNAHSCDCGEEARESAFAALRDWSPKAADE